MRKESTTEQAASTEGGPDAKRVRLPGFLVQGELGLGDALKKMTSYFHIAPCSACERRATKLNAWITLAGPGKK